MNSRTRALLLLLLAAVILWISNEKLLYFRDNYYTHYPVKSLTQEFVSDGLPLWNPHIDGGQPLAGNSNNLTFYPTTLLYLLLPSHIAFNLHFVIHLVVAWFGMRWALDQYGLHRRDGSRGAWLYLLSGTTVSCLIFYNLVVTMAWMPWALGALIRLLRYRTITNALYLGTACGLIGLAAEPVVVLGFTVLALALFVSRFSKAALVPMACAVATAAVIASPQLLAFSEIAAETERAHFPYQAEAALAGSLGPDRLAELVTGPIFGSILDVSPNGFWANQEGRRYPPFFLSVILSALFLPALLRRPGEELLPLQLTLLLLLALAAGRFNPPVEWLFQHVQSLGFLRHPEKLALVVTLIATILIGILLRDLEKRDFRIAAWAAVCIILAAALAVLLSTSMSTVANVRLISVSLLQVLVMVPLIRANNLNYLKRTVWLLALVPLAYWSANSIALDDAVYYTQPSPVAQAVEGNVIEVATVMGDSVIEPREMHRLYAFRVSPGIGIRYGASYVLSGSPEGMHSYLSRLSAERHRSVEPSVKLRYLRINGAAYTIQPQPLELPGFERSRVGHVPTRRVYLYRISDTRPLLWEPSAIVRAEHANEAVKIIESPETDPNETSVVPLWVNEDLRPRGNSRITLLSRSSQRMSFQVESETDTVVVVNQTWFSAWRARAGDRELVTFPADISRLGIIIPRGTTTVELEFGRRRLLIACALALSGFTMLYALGLAIVSSRRTAEPAR